MVKKIHGTIPNSEDYSWIKVKDKKNNKWVSYDITQRDCKITSDHLEITECIEWIDIVNILIDNHLRFIQQKDHS